MKIDVLFGMIPCSKTRVRCVLCGVHVPKAVRCIEQHANGARHLQSIQLMKDNGLYFEDDALQCKPCDVTLSAEDSALNHIEGHVHGNWAAAMEDLTDGEFIVLDSYLSLESDNAFCKVCNKPVRCTLETVENHVNGLEHRENVCKYLCPRNGMFTSQNGMRVWCKVCNVYLDNDVQMILNHLDDSVEHMHWFMDVEDLIQDQHVSVMEFLTIEKETKAYCKKCDIDMICNPNVIEAHVHSESHLYRFT